LLEHGDSLPFQLALSLKRLQNELEFLTHILTVGRSLCFDRAGRPLYDGLVCQDLDLAQFLNDFSRFVAHLIIFRRPKHPDDQLDDLSLGLRRAVESHEDLAVFLYALLEVLEALFALIKDAVDENLLTLDNFDDLFAWLLGKQRIQDNLCLWVFGKLRGRRGLKWCLRRHIAVELDIQLILHFFLEAKSA
jgi:hypothetical protein